MDLEGIMTYRVYRCLICKADGTWFSSDANTQEGRQGIVDHMRDEHGEDYDLDGL